MKLPVHFFHILNVIPVCNNGDGTVNKWWQDLRSTILLTLSFIMDWENETIEKVREIPSVLEKEGDSKLALASLVRLSPWWKDSNYGMWLLCSEACACLEILKNLVESQKNSQDRDRKTEQSIWERLIISDLFMIIKEACQLQTIGCDSYLIIPVSLSCCIWNSMLSHKNWKEISMCSFQMT